MHPVRRFILLRWLAYVLVIAGTVGLLLSRQAIIPTFTSDAMKRLAPPKLELPAAADSSMLRAALDVLQGRQVPFGKVEQVSPSLIALHEEITATGQKKVPVELSVIFMGPPKKFAIINGVAYEAGASLPDGRLLMDIQRDAVVLAVGDSLERYEWMPNFRVELKKAAAKARAKEVVAAQGAVPAGAEGGGAKAQPLADVPENPTPEQALGIMQQLKQQQSKSQ